MTAREIVDAMIDQGGADAALLERDLWSAFLVEMDLKPQRCPLSSNDVFVEYRGWELRESGVA